MAIPTTSLHDKIKTIEKRIAEIREQQQATNCMQHEKTTLNSTETTGSGYKLSGGLDTKGNGSVGTADKPSGNVSLDGQGHIGGHYESQRIANQDTKVTIQGDGCNGTVTQQLYDEEAALSQELAVLKEQVRDFDSYMQAIDRLPEDQAPCLTETDSDVIFKDRVKVCRTNAEGDLDRNGACLTTEHTTDNWPEFLERGKETNCLGTMKSIDLSKKTQTEDTEVLQALADAGLIDLKEDSSIESKDNIDATISSDDSGTEIA